MIRSTTYPFYDTSIETDVKELIDFTLKDLMKRKIISSWVRDPSLVEVLYYSTTSRPCLLHHLYRDQLTPPIRARNAPNSLYSL